MSYQISEVLFDWLQKKRLISAVARRMNVVENTLIAQLRPSTSTSKFAADDLIALFDAIRDEGYGAELVGIVKEYTDRLHGEIKNLPGELDMQVQIYRLMSGIGGITERLADSAKHSSERDLVALLNKLRTEVLPVVLQLEAILADRLDKVRRRDQGASRDPDIQTP